MLKLGVVRYESFGQLLSQMHVKLSRMISPVLILTVVSLTAFLITFFITDVAPYYISIGYPHMVPIMSVCALLDGVIILYFYFKASLTPPGYAPTVEQLHKSGYNFTIRTDPTEPGCSPSQIFSPTDPSLPSLRLCPHCNAVRVPRSHHCKTCDKCILRMDHHCVWIGNCVGHRNQKYFILFMFYLVAGTLLYTIFAVPMIVQLHDRSSPFCEVYSYNWNTFALSCAIALTVSVLGMGGYNVFLTCLGVSSVEMAQRQANMRYLRYRERLVAEARKRGASDELIARMVPPLDDEDMLLQMPKATRKSVIENLRFLFGARENELIIWSMLPLLRETGGDGYYLPSQCYNSSRQTNIPSTEIEPSKTPSSTTDSTVSSSSSSSSTTDSTVSSSTTTATVSTT